MPLSSLTLYERGIINKLIPALPSSGSMPLHINLINIIFSDNAERLATKEITHRHLGELVTVSSHNIIQFLIINDFVRRKEDGSFEIHANGPALCRAGSVEMYFGV